MKHFQSGYLVQALVMLSLLIISVQSDSSFKEEACRTVEQSSFVQMVSFEEDGEDEVCIEPPISSMKVLEDTDTENVEILLMKEANRLEDLLKVHPLKMNMTSTSEQSTSESLEQPHGNHHFNSLPAWLAFLLLAMLVSASILRMTQNPSKANRIMILEKFRK